jgi:hypothetical protein
MADPMTEPVSLTEAERLLGGDSEVLGALGGAPLLVVDLDGIPRRRLRVPPAAPLVVVGVSGEARLSPDAGACDVLLTVAPHPPAPWVGGGPVDGAVARVAAAVVANPVAAVMLAQLLRRGWEGPARPGGEAAQIGEPAPATRSMLDDLLAESFVYSTLLAAAEFRRWLGTQPHRHPAQESTEPVIVQRTGDEVEVTLNRPHVRNAYSAAMRDGLVEALRLVAADPSVSHVHLRGNGPDFCSGGDLTEFGTARDPAEAHLVRTVRSVGAWTARSADRVTAHLHGACVGAGIELPAFAARVIAAPGTWMALPEVGMGLVPGAGGTASIPRRIGRQRTAWLALTGARIDAGTAVEWGLADGLEE